MSNLPRNDTATPLTEWPSLLWRDWRGRVLFVAAVLTALIVPLAVVSHLVSDWSVLTPIYHWLSGKYPNQADSWMPMQKALEWHRQHGSGMYEEIFFTEGVKFQYPPSSLLPLLGLQALGIDPSFQLLNEINRVIVVLAAAGIGLLSYRLLAPLEAQGPTARVVRRLVSIYVAVAALIFYPVMMPVSIGQIQAWINSAFVFACIAWFADRRALAGFLIGCVCLLKPQFALFALWGLLRREWHLVAAMVVTGVVGLTISVLVFGISDHLDFLRVLSFISARGESYLPNQSFNGLLHLFVGHDSIWHEREFPPYNPIVHYGTLATSAVIVILAMASPRGQTPINRLIGFQFAALAFTLASPIAWEHHFGVLAPMLATAFAALLLRPTVQKARTDLLWLAACYVLTSSYLGFLKVFAETPLAIVQYYLFVGALGLFALQWRLTGRPATNEPNS
jgi:hypothetical protein